ncbi:anti-sigma factor [Microlunatus lacustris]
MSDIHGAAGSYVVHGLGAAEHAEFERHLRHCRACQVEVRELRETAAELSRLTSRTPPPGLRIRVLSSIRRYRPLPPPPSTPSSAPVVPEAAGTASAAPPRSPARPLVLALAAALALVLALGGVVLGQGQQHRLELVQTERESQLMTAEDTTVHRAVLAGGHPVTLVVSRRQDRALLVGAELPVLDPDHRYQLWTQDRSGAMVAGPVFRSADRHRVWLTTGVTRAVAVAVTVEPPGGSARPSTSPEVIASF